MSEPIFDNDQIERRLQETVSWLERMEEHYEEGRLARPTGEQVAIGLDTGAPPAVRWSTHELLVVFRMAMLGASSVRELDLLRNRVTPHILVESSLADIGLIEHINDVPELLENLLAAARAGLRYVEAMMRHNEGVEVRPGVRMVQGPELDELFVAWHQATLSALPDEEVEHHRSMLTGRGGAG